jgi:hypothetical protein
MSNKRLVGGGNILKGLPPTSTNFYGLISGSHSRKCAKAGMALPPIPPPPIWSSGTGFSVGVSSNGIFHDIGHHFNIVSSGDGSGNSGGFDSTKEPYSSPGYVSFTGTGVLDPLPNVQRHCVNHFSVSACVDPDHSIVTEANWRKQGRYMRSKTLAQMNVTPSSWGQLKEITITWIAGSNNNGGDRPDMHRFNVGVENQTGLPTDGADGDYHERESLYVEFFDNNNLPMGKRFFLWMPKRHLTLAELNSFSAGGHPVGTLNPLTELPDLHTYPSAGGFPNGGGASSETEFTTTVITAADFGINLSLAKFFVIRQTRHTDVLDSYGIKYVNIEFIPS